VQSLLQLRLTQDLPSTAPTSRVQYALVPSRLEPLHAAGQAINVVGASGLVSNANLPAAVSNWKRQDPIPPPTVQEANAWWPIPEHLSTDLAQGNKNSVQVAFFEDEDESEERQEREEGGWTRFRPVLIDSALIFQTQNFHTRILEAQTFFRLRF